MCAYNFCSVPLPLKNFGPKSRLNASNINGCGEFFAPKTFKQKPVLDSQKVVPLSHSPTLPLYHSTTQKMLDKKKKVSLEKSFTRTTFILKENIRSNAMAL
jgi:hypothetical protein